MQLTDVVARHAAALVPLIRHGTTQLVQFSCTKYTKKWWVRSQSVVNEVKIHAEQEKYRCIGVYRPGTIVHKIRNNPFCYMT